MSKPNNRRKIIAKNLFKKMRLLVINEDTLEEKFSLRLTLMNVFVVLTLGAIIIISVTTYIIAFTPLREYIPGYSSSILKKSATELAIKSDSLVLIIFFKACLISLALSDLNSKPFLPSCKNCSLAPT